MGQNSVLLKGDFGLREELSYTICFTHYFSHKIYVRNLLRVIRQGGSYEGVSSREAVANWVIGEYADESAQGIHWFSNTTGIARPKRSSPKVTQKRVEKAHSKNDWICFAYWKLGQGEDRVLVARTGRVDSIDLKRGIFRVKSGFYKSRNFLLSEVEGFYSSRDYPQVSRFSFTPMSKGRTRVSIEKLSHDEYLETANRRTPKKRGQKVTGVDPKATTSLLSVLAGASGESDELVGQLLELVTANGEKLGLRVEYLKKPSMDAPPREDARSLSADSSAASSVLCADPIAREEDEHEQS